MGEQVQPELRTARRDLPPSTTRQRRKKRRKTDANRDDIQRRLFLRRRRPKGPIMQVRTRTTKKKRLKRSKPVFAQPFFLISNFTSAEYLSYQTGHLKSSTETTGCPETLDPFLVRSTLRTVDRSRKKIFVLF